MSATTPIIAVFSGGTSAEREVSIGSGRACALALARSFPTRLFDVTTNALPDGLDPQRHVVFSTLHGTFGEDGGMQRLLEAAGVHYAGCGVASSALTIDKAKTKQRTALAGLKAIPGRMFSAEKKPSSAEIEAEFGRDVVVKPNDEGSSVGLRIVGSAADLTAALASAAKGDWLVEKRIFGRELAVGVMSGKAMGVVEIRPKSGVYDYASKYTKGLTDYFAPAPFDEKTTQEIQRAAETAFSACGCRDYARVDFIFSQEGELFFLEINPLPGMKETSLLPMSARCAGLDFTALVREMVTPALQRFKMAAPALPP